MDQPEDDLRARRKRLKMPGEARRESGKRQQNARSGKAQPPAPRVSTRKTRLQAPVVSAPRPMLHFATTSEPPPSLAPAVPPPSSPEARPAEHVDRGLPVPAEYGLDRLVALTRDPQWLFSYWELHGPKLAEIVQSRGRAFVDSCAWALRLYRLDESVALDFEIDAAAGNWYVNVGAPGRYQLELALLSPEGEWISLLVSQVVQTPAAEPSAVVDEQWRMRSEDEDALGAYLRRAASASSEALGSRAVSSFALAMPTSWTGASQGGPPAGSMIWHRQTKLPGGTLGRTQQPHFKVKLPRRVEEATAPALLGGGKNA